MHCQAPNCMLHAKDKKESNQHPQILFNQKILSNGQDRSFETKLVTRVCGMTRANLTMVETYLREEQSIPEKGSR